MNKSILMPSLGADMKEGKIMEWKIKEGDAVTKSEIIALVETNKSVLEIESLYTGQVVKLLKKTGDIISVGSEIAVFDVSHDEDEASSQRQQQPSLQTNKRAEITPRARKILSEHQLKIDDVLKEVKGAGKNGRIEVQDVELFLNHHQSDRALIASLMSESKKNIPHYYLRKKVCLKNYLQFLDQLNLSFQSEKRLMIYSGLLKSISLSLLKWPHLNGHFMNNRFYPSNKIHLGVVVDDKNHKILVPSILDSQDLSSTEINDQLILLLQKIKKGSFKREEMMSKTISVTYLGDQGVDEVFGIIHPPQVALVGIGRIFEDFILVNEKIEKSFFINVTLSADHRVTDGMYGSGFLNSFEKCLLHPDDHLK